MKTYKAQWFRYATGRYLSADESFGGIKKINATDLESAIEIAKEAEGCDSEIPFTDRVNVWEVFDFVPGDKVMVLKGEHAGVHGIVQPLLSFTGDNYTVWLDNFSIVDKFTFHGENLEMVKSLSKMNAEMRMMESGIDPYK